jgi:hypothetical protein
MDDEGSRKKFHKSENKFKYYHRLACLLLTCGCVIFMMEIFRLIILKAIFILINILILVGLSYSYTSLTHLIRIYHPTRFLEISKQMKFFFFVETTPMLVQIIFQIIDIINDLYPNFLYANVFFVCYIINYIIWTIYPLF